MDSDIGELSVGRRLYLHSAGNISFTVSATDGLSTVGSLNGFSSFVEDNKRRRTGALRDFTWPAVISDDRTKLRCSRQEKQSHSARDSRVMLHNDYMQFH